MKLKGPLIKASIAAALGLGVLGQAQASIYGGSMLEIRDLAVTVTGVNAPAVTNFAFDLTNTANLNGDPAIAIASCGGAPSPGVNDCNVGSPALDAQPAQLGTAQVNNFFTYLGPGAGEYARSDSVITNAQLTNGVPTDTQNIAEAELQTGINAAAVSNIQSITGFSFTFTIDGPGNITVAFDANVDLLAAIADPGASTANAQAQTTTQFLFSQDNTGNSLGWDPTTPTGGADPTCANDVSISGIGITCNSETVAQNLNNNVGTTLVPNSSDSYSRGDNFFGSYFLDIDFAVAGQYTLTLSETKDVSVRRTAAVPEPTALLILGAGLAGLGFTRRLKKG